MAKKAWLIRLNVSVADYVLATFLRFSVLAILARQSVLTLLQQLRMKFKTMPSISVRYHVSLGKSESPKTLKEKIYEQLAMHGLSVYL